jgi:hypothetical protein
VRFNSLLTALLGVFPCLALAAAAAPSVPDTPAGRALSAWLDAFNSGDRMRAESFIKAQASWLDLDHVMRWRAETGGYDLLTTYTSDQTQLVFRVQARASSDEEIGRVKVSAREPALITELGLFRIPAGARFEAVTLDATARARVIEQLAKILDDSYVFPAIANKMSTAVRAHARQGKYRLLVDGGDFATKLTADLREVSHDKHVEVRFSFVVQPADLSARRPEEQATLRRRLAAVNCGFEKAEHLAPNIGYLKFNMFADPDICAQTASGAMNFLADTDALILDLRDNNGGRGGMVEFIASYLFTERTRLNDTFKRPENLTLESWTLPYVPGRKFTGKPVFVLTSKRTFSAAEDFCYVLKNLNRATLIGETTGGGAHPVDVKRIDDHFSVIVPTGRSISPITKTDWEGTGIEPDVKVAAAEALDVAQKLATEQSGKERSHGAEAR